MKNQSNVNTQEPAAWPRDFDIRARYAEQKELLTAEFSPRVDIPARLEPPVQGTDKND